MEDKIKVEFVADVPQIICSNGFNGRVKKGDQIMITESLMNELNGKAFVKFEKVIEKKTTKKEEK